MTLWRVAPLGDVLFSVRTAGVSFTDFNLADRKDGSVLFGGTVDRGGYQDAVLAAYSATGALLWQKTIDFGVNESIRSILVAEDGSFTLGIGPRYYTWNGFVANYSADGNLRWQLDLGHSTSVAELHHLKGGDILLLGRYDIYSGYRAMLGRISPQGVIRWALRDDGFLGQSPTAKPMPDGRVRIAGDNLHIRLMELDVDGRVLRTATGRTCDPGIIRFRSANAIDVSAGRDGSRDRDLEVFRLSWWSE